MEKSLFQKAAPRPNVPSPYELIEPEIVHLKKGYSIRYGPKAPKRAPPWVLVIGFLALAWFYLMDPIMHAWYRGEAVHTYLYLHNYGSGELASKLAATQILNADEINTLNHRQGSFQDYYSTPADAVKEANVIIKYMDDVKLLHSKNYQQLDPVGRLRYLLFIRTNLFLPTSWDFLDPGIGS